MNLIEKNSFPIFSKANVLYIEDELVINSSMTKQLNFFKDEEVISTINCQNAFEIFEKSQFDLIISDIFTPIMNGVEFIKKVRQENQDIKIFVVTGFDINNVKMDLKGINVDGFFEKPIRINKLLSEIESSLNN